MLERKVLYIKKDEVDEVVVKELLSVMVSYGIEEAELHLKMLGQQAKMYRAEIEFLENTKPFFFQKKKLVAHIKDIEECELKLYETYKQMNDEAIYIMKLRNSKILENVN